jgi:hypothetical protein
MSTDFSAISQEPRKASNANGSVERHSLAEMIEADRYERSKNAAKSKIRSVFALGNTKAVPPGAR